MQNDINSSSTVFIKEFLIHDITKNVKNNFFKEHFSIKIERIEYLVYQLEQRDKRVILYQKNV